MAIVDEGQLSYEAWEMAGRISAGRSIGQRGMTKPLTTEERIAKIRARVAAIPSGAVTLHAPVDVPFLLATIDARDKSIAERDAEIARLRDENAAIRAEIGAVIKRVDEASERFRFRRGA